MSTPKKRRARKAKAAAPLAARNSTARKAVKIGAIGAAAWTASRTLFSVARIAVGSLLVIAAAAAAASLVPKETQRQIAGGARDFAQLAYDRARSLTA